MLYPKQTNCSENGNINSLISSIDCRLSKLANTMFNNTVFMLNKTISGTEMFDLIQYKRILYYKQINPDYACNYSVNMITSKVKLLASNCVKNCFDAPPIRVTTTTTTTPCPTTTTTSSSTSTSTTTSSSSTSTSTTTSTTTTIPTRYYYDVSFYDCGSCGSATGGGAFDNSEPLTVGKWYINSGGIVIYIVSFASSSPGVSINNILNSSQQSNCIDIICP